MLRAASPSRGMTPEERSRSRTRLAGVVAGAAVAGGLSWLPGAAFGAGLGLIVGIGTLVAPPAWFTADPPPSGAPVPGKAPVSPPRTTAEVESTSAPVSSEVVPAARPAATPQVSATASLVAPEDVLAEEVALLNRASAALSGSPAEALRLTGEHAARYPRGKLGVEREMVAIDALRRLGRTAEARSRADALLARPGGSMYEERIRGMF